MGWLLDKDAHTTHNPQHDGRCQAHLSEGVQDSNWQKPAAQSAGQRCRKGSLGKSQGQGQVLSEGKVCPTPKGGSGKCPSG